MATATVQEQSGDIESLRAEVAGLRAMLFDSKAVAPAEWRLTAAETRVFRVLLAVDTCTRKIIAEGAQVPETRTVDVHITRIRNKTKPFSVRIESVVGSGWRLVGRTTWAGLLAAPNA
jgi:DNA-binding response OmpR family regulator